MELAFAYFLFFSPPLAAVCALALSLRRRTEWLQWVRQEPWTAMAVAAITTLGLAGSIRSPHPWSALLGVVAMIALFWLKLVATHILQEPQRVWVHLQYASGIMGILALLAAYSPVTVEVGLPGARLLVVAPPSVSPGGKGTVFGLGANGLGPLLVLGATLGLARAVSDASLRSRVEGAAVFLASFSGVLALNVRNALWGGLVAAASLAVAGGVAPLVMVAATAAAVFASKPEVLLRLVRLFVVPSSELERWDIWRTAVAMIRDHPFLGVGPFGFSRAVELYPHPASSLLTDPHSIYLRVAVEWGIPAAIIWFAWCYRWIWVMWPARRDVVRWSCISAWLAFLAMGIFDTPLFTFHISGPAMVLLGLGTRNPPQRQRQWQHRATGLLNTRGPSILRTER